MKYDSISPIPLVKYNSTDLLILVPGDVFWGEDEPVVPAAPLHDPQVVDCHVAFPDHLQENEEKNMETDWGSSTWLPSFRPVFSAFWVVVCALENLTHHKTILFVLRHWQKARKEISFVLWNCLFNCLLDIVDVTTRVNCLKEEHSSRKLVEISIHSSSRDYLAPAKSSYLEVHEWKRCRNKNGHSSQ